MHTGIAATTHTRSTSSMEFPLKGEETYAYDWKVKLQPSNKEFRIAKIEHESLTSKTHHCTNGVSFSINDSAVTVPGNPYSITPYYVSDIMVEYWY